MAAVLISAAQASMKLRRRWLAAGATRPSWRWSRIT
jgi:hypothetical protein